MSQCLPPGPSELVGCDFQGTSLPTEGRGKGCLPTACPSAAEYLPCALLVTLLHLCPCRQAPTGGGVGRGGEDGKGSSSFKLQELLFSLPLGLERVRAVTRPRATASLAHFLKTWHSVPAASKAWEDCRALPQEFQIQSPGMGPHVFYF